jgi:hypothetical protein
LCEAGNNAGFEEPHQREALAQNNTKNTHIYVVVHDEMQYTETKQKKKKMANLTTEKLHMRNGAERQEINEGCNKRLRHEEITP